MTEAAIRLESTHTVSETGLVLLESISLLLFPYMITFLLGEQMCPLVIWEFSNTQVFVSFPGHF